MNNIGKILIVLGIIFIAAGIVLVVFKKIPFNLGKLPGDITINKENFSFYFPITTCIIISVIVSAILYLISKFSGK